MREGFKSGEHESEQKTFVEIKAHLFATVEEAKVFFERNVSMGAGFYLLSTTDRITGKPCGLEAAGSNSSKRLKLLELTNGQFRFTDEGVVNILSKEIDLDPRGPGSGAKKFFPS